MDQNLVRRGQKVVLENVKNDQIQRHTFVVDTFSPQHILLIPLTEGDIVLLYEPENCVRGYIPTPARTYQFESRIIQSKRLPSPFLAIEVPKQIVPVQRRRFFRIRVLHFVQLIPFSNGGEPLLEKPIEVYGTDINGGGVGLRVEMKKVSPNLRFREHQRLRLTLMLPPIEKVFPKGITIETLGEIVWIKGNSKAISLGVAFTSIDKRLQERIIAWCFAFQCRLLRLGLMLEE